MIYNMYLTKISDDTTQINLPYNHLQVATPLCHLLTIHYHSRCKTDLLSFTTPTNRNQWHWCSAKSTCCISWHCCLSALFGPSLNLQLPCDYKYWMRYCKILCYIPQKRRKPKMAASMTSSSAAHYTLSQTTQAKRNSACINSFLATLY